MLPRPKDALGSARDLHDRRHEGASRSPTNMEMVVIDISDASMSLVVAQQEIPHTLAPHIKDDGYYAFIALFGYKTGPLLWCRVRSLLARLLQSLVGGGHEGQHQMYIDDALWFLQGDLKTRNLVLSMLLTTTAALGFKISVKKGARSAQLTWASNSDRRPPHHEPPQDLHEGFGQAPRQLGQPWNGSHERAAPSSGESVLVAAASLSPPTIHNSLLYTFNNPGGNLTRHVTPNLHHDRTVLHSEFVLRLLQLAQMSQLIDIRPLGHWNHRCPPHHRGHGRRLVPTWCCCGSASKQPVGHWIKSSSSTRA